MLFACCCQKAVHDTFEGEQLMFREIICSIFVNVFSEQVALILFSFSELPQCECFRRKVKTTKKLYVGHGERRFTENVQCQ